MINMPVLNIVTGVCRLFMLRLELSRVTMLLLVAVHQVGVLLFYARVLERTLLNERCMLVQDKGAWSEVVDFSTLFAN